MIDATISSAVAIVYLATVAFAVGVFAFGLTFRGRVAALIGAQLSLALQALLARWESVHWLVWPLYWPALKSAEWFHPRDPNGTFLEGIAWAIGTAVIAFLIGFGANSVLLGTLCGVIYDAVRWFRRRASPGPNVPGSTPFPDGFRDERPRA